jgi:hypothetical protein
MRDRGQTVERVSADRVDRRGERDVSLATVGKREEKLSRREREAAITVEALDPGVPYESRWAPYDRAHGPGQGQLPEGSIRPRGYMASDERRSLA